MHAARCKPELACSNLKATAVHIKLPVSSHPKSVYQLHFARFHRHPLVHETSSRNALTKSAHETRSRDTLTKHTHYSCRLSLDSTLRIRSAMCLRSSIDRFAIPCMYEIEGIITMPVRRPVVYHDYRIFVLTVTGTWTSLPRLLGAWRHRMGHSRQMLSPMWHTRQLV